MFSEQSVNPKILNRLFVLLKLQPPRIILSVVIYLFHYHPHHHHHRDMVTRGPGYVSEISDNCPVKQNGSVAISLLFDVLYHFGLHIPPTSPVKKQLFYENICINDMLMRMVKVRLHYCGYRLGYAICETHSLCHP